MKKLKVFSLISIACSLAACRLDGPTGISGDGDSLRLQLSGSINQIYQTRVNDGGFCDGDVIGVYVVDYENGNPGTLLDNGNRATNVRHTFVEGANRWEPAYDIFYKDKKTPVDIYAYYPFAEISSVNSVAFEIQKNQSSSAMNGMLGGYEASDFLWGKTGNVMPSNSVVSVSLGHIMSSVRVTLVQGTGFEEDEWENTDRSVTVLNTARNVVIDLSDGSVALDEDGVKSEIIPYRNGNDYRAIVAPQTMDAQTKLFGITVGGMSYSFTKDEAVTFVKGKQNNFTITVNKKVGSGYELVLSGESITPWENDTVGHDAVSREYVIVDVDKAGTLDECVVNAGLDVKKIRNLKITGQITSRDFAVMKFRMPLLTALNLKEAVIVAGEDGNLGDNDTYYEACRDDEIPCYAMNKKESLTTLVLPDRLKYISGSPGGAKGAFAECRNLSGSLIIPEGVVEIGPASFISCESLTGTLILPSTLKRIGIVGEGTAYWDGAFKGCNFTCELKLPDGLEEIGVGSFAECRNLYGDLKLPENLKKIGHEAFMGCENIRGSLVIPQSITTVPSNCFNGCWMGGTLTLHDGIIAIGDGAFANNGFKGELYLPKDLEVINHNVFYNCDFSGTLVLPEGLRTIGDKCFAYNWRLAGVLEIPENVISIGAGAFAKCRSLEGIIFPKDLENIRYNSSWSEDGGAFQDCFGIGRIVCKGTVPAYVQEGAFHGVPKDNFVLEVPEESVHLYQSEVGWKEFKRISAYRNLVVRPQVATAINTSVSRNLVLDAEGEWVVESIPEWVSLDRTSGNGKTELTLTFSEMPAGQDRTGEVVFKLKDKDYRTRCKLTQYDYEYAEDEWITLQKASRGNGVNIVFLGDGYNAFDISEGRLLADMQQSVEHFFSIEPYRSYREYFNIYTAVSVSAESGVGTVNTIVYNRFGTTFKGGVNVSAKDRDFATIFRYVIDGENEVTEHNLNQTLVVMIPNTVDYGGICYMWDDGSAIAYCPKSDYGYPFDWRGTIQHEAGGHGFAKLGDEYIYHNAFIDNCGCACCGHMFELSQAFDKGWYVNLSLTGKMSEVKWNHLIFHEKYSHIVDVFEGGFMHSRGVYRSEQNSCMNNDIPYYNTISRQEMVRRIMEYSGEGYSFEKFVERDVIESAPGTRSGELTVLAGRQSMHRHAPVIVGSKPDLNL